MGCWLFTKPPPLLALWFEPHLFSPISVFVSVPPSVLFNYVNCFSWEPLLYCTVPLAVSGQRTEHLNTEDHLYGLWGTLEVYVGITWLPLPSWISVRIKINWDNPGLAIFPLQFIFHFTYTLTLCPLSNGLSYTRGPWCWICSKWRLVSNSVFLF